MKRFKRNVEEIREVYIGKKVFMIIKDKDSGEHDMVSINDLVDKYMEDVVDEGLQSQNQYISPRVIEHIEKIELIDEINHFLDRINSYEKKKEKRKR